MFTNLLNMKTNMQAKNLGYSMKNILILPKHCYLKSVIKKVESFSTRLRWEVYIFDKKECPVNNMNLGFKSNFTSPQHELLSPREKCPNTEFFLVSQSEYIKIRT